ATTCDDGCAELFATAQAHVVGVTLHARDASGATGTWFGPLPVAPGAFFVEAPRVIEEEKPEVAVLMAPNPRGVVYAEIDDEQGRVAGAALHVAPDETDAKNAVPRARFEIPPLSAGLHWIVVSGEPRGAERLAGAAIARPFFVGHAPAP